MKPGAIFGELNLLDFEEDRHEMAIAVEDSEVCFIPAETVKQLMAVIQLSGKASTNPSVSELKRWKSECSR